MRIDELIKRGIVRSVDDAGGGDGEPEGYEFEQGDPADEQPEPVEPEKPDTGELEALKAQLSEMREMLSQRQQPAQAEPEDPYAGLEDLMYSDPPAYHRRVAEIAKQEALRELTPHFEPMRRYMVESTTSDLQPDEKQAFEATVRGLGLDPAQVAQNPAVAEVFKKAARFDAGLRHRPAPGAERIGGGGIDYERAQDRRLYDTVFGDVPGSSYEDFMKFVNGGRR